MNRVYRFLYRLDSYKLILIGVVLPFLLNALVVVISEIFRIEADIGRGYEVNFTNLFVMVVIGPLIETVFAHYLPLKFAGLFFPKYKFVFLYTIIIASILFGALHSQSIRYMMIAFGYGLVWMTCCFVFIRQKKSPILYTWLIHSSYNGLLFGLTFLVHMVCISRS